MRGLVQLFFFSKEVDIYSQHQRQLIEGSSEDFVVSTTYTGKPSRIYKTEILEKWNSQNLPTLPMPLQFVLFDDFVWSAEQSKKYELMNNPAGQISGMINEVKKIEFLMGNFQISMKLEQWPQLKLSRLINTIKFLESIGIDNIIKHEKELIEYGQEILKKNNSVKLIGNPKERGGVLSFTVEGVHPHDIATILDETGVAIRAGHHCCQILHDKLGIPASARASLGVYNTKDDLDKLNEGINNCKKIFDLK